MARTLSADERQDLEAALEEVQTCQTFFWDALSRLEGLLDNIELDGNTDFEDYTVDQLLEEEEEEEEEEKTDALCRQCRQPFPDGGDGYDGLCASCADRREETTDAT